MEVSTATNADMSEATAVVRAYCDAWLAGDTATVLSLYHDDLTLVWPGRHRFAGVHEGQAAAIEALLGLQAATNRRPVEVLDLMTGHAAVMVTVIERWTRDEDESTSIEITRGLEYTVVDGKLRTCRLYETDQPAVEEWLADTGDRTSEPDHSELLARCSLGWASRDVDAILACHTEDTVFHHRGVAEPAIGADAVRDAFGALMVANPDLTTRTERTTMGRTHAIVEYEVTTTVDDVPVAAPAVDVFHFRDGLISRKDTWVTPLR